jgi:hypothetical protein
MNVDWRKDLVLPEWFLLKVADLSKQVFISSANLNQLNFVYWFLNDKVLPIFIAGNFNRKIGDWLLNIYVYIYFFFGGTGVW